MSDSHRIPGWLYHFLPHLYVAAGLAAAFELPNLWGMASGVMLLLAGCLVFWIRWKYRSALRHAAIREEAKRMAAAAIAGDAHLLAWRDEYACGIAEIDAQHRKIVEVANNLLIAVHDRKSRLDVELLLDDLAHEVRKHLASEENLLIETGHPPSPAYLSIQRYLWTRCQIVAEQFHKNEFHTDDLVQFVHNDIVAQHVQKEHPLVRPHINVMDMPISDFSNLRGAPPTS